MSNVAIIPARGGSKRIPGKNIKDFCGKPIIAYSIEAALASGLFDRVIVSTDSEEIAEVAKLYGAEVPFMRPDELSNDYATTAAVLVHALEWLEAKGSRQDYACTIYPTAPFVTTALLLEGYEKLKNEKATAAFTTTALSFPIFQGFVLNKNNRLDLLWPEHRTTRSQDMPRVYYDAGQFYWVRTDKFLIEKQVISDDSIPVELPKYLAHDIDTIDDWIWAELVFKFLKTNNRI